jgi:hypothetical protein
MILLNFGQNKSIKMIIERTNKEIIIKLPNFIDTNGLEDFFDYLSYKEATENSKAKQEDIDRLVKEIKKDWWKKNRNKFIK